MSQTWARLWGPRATAPNAATSCAPRYQAAVQPRLLPSVQPSDAMQRCPMLTVSSLGRECAFPRRQHWACPPPRRARTAPPHLPPRRGRSSTRPLARCCPGPPLLLQAYNTQVKRALLRHTPVRAFQPLPIHPWPPSGAAGVDLFHQALSRSPSVFAGAAAGRTTPGQRLPEPAAPADALLSSSWLPSSRASHVGLHRQHQP